MSMPHSLRSLLQVSVYRRRGRPALVLPSVSSPYKMSLGMRPGSMLDMAKPAQASLAKHDKQTVHVGSFAHLRVWHSLFPMDTENAPQASHVEAV